MRSGGVVSAVALGGAAATIVLVVGDTGPAAVGAAYVAAVAVPLAVTDAREHRLPNALVLPGYAFAAVGVVWAWLARGSSPGAVVACAVGTLVVMAMLGAGGAIGMGDVKLAGLLSGALAAVAGERGPPEFSGVSAFAAVIAWAVISALTAGAAGVAEFWAGRGAGAELALGPILLAAFGVVVVVLGWPS